MGIEIGVRIICEDEEEKILKAEQFSDGLSFEELFHLFKFCCRLNKPFCLRRIIFR